ncbi:CYTH and CHAD domain-containing protein [Dactylosporangium matsuzakiense]|uniref:CHAD domain-containing protein n=1 Tax=Dactylosporangium matsuzakiense TaxID=53360 RepID=A0A9W6NM96_9ACTN|nr:CYTH and CHAD domain-containing protein [Dactylosporangium matsuzakiense]UWZ46296.1 CYTH and CHAD domain-containing protein [Dactylosporangium matsuzakiense]GLL01991.1 CHAD domain-containing protein [Dactylosporangium matsuzakiense]
MLEEERKYLAGDGFTMPDLGAAGRVSAREPVTLRATYYDTPERLLTRHGISLRYRKGDVAAKVWTVKLPSSRSGVRFEYSRPSQGAGVVPPSLLDLVTAYRRGRPLAPAAVLRTVRTVYEVSGVDGRLLAEVADDSVSVLDGRDVALRFREIEVELVDGDRAVLDEVEKLLLAAGARAGTGADAFVPKHVRALEALGSREAPLLAARARPRPAHAGDVVTEAIRRDVARILKHDPFARMRETMPNGDTPVHQMRVGTRRLRSDLQTFQALLDPRWTARLREELAWLAGALGGARDVEVLRERLFRTAAADPLAPVDPRAVARIDAALARQQDSALRVLDKALRSRRYVKLLDALVAAVEEPRLAPLAWEPAENVLAGIVRKPWRRLVDGNDEVVGAGALTPDLPDYDWHEVRKRAKRARYAADAVSAVLGPEARLLAKAVARAQGVLGEHQDAAIAGDAWLEAAAAAPDDHALAVAAGRLFERERATVTRARADFPAVWEMVMEEKNIAWLR